MRGLRRGIVVLLLVAASAGLVALARRSDAGRLVKPETAEPHRPPVSTGLDGAGRTPAEQAAVTRTLRGRLRCAEDTDAEESDERGGLQDLYATYHPYFVRGDLNQDGRLDFAQGFIRLGGGEVWFDVAVFFGQPDGTFSEASYVERGIRLEHGDLSIERTLLVVTPDLSYDEIRRWRFDSSLKRFVDADAVSTAETEDEAPDESPDARPRIRV